MKQAAPAGLPDEPKLYDADGYRCETGVEPRFVLVQSYELLHLAATEQMASTKQEVAAWMIKNSFATGHGDSVADLLKELDWQIAALQANAALLIEAYRAYKAGLAQGGDKPNRGYIDVFLAIDAEKGTQS